LTGEQVRGGQLPLIVLQQVLIIFIFTAVKEVTALPVTENEPLDIVLKQYDINVLDIRNESYKDKKGVWWIKTNKGMKILKKISNSEQTLLFILDAVRHLISNGIHIPQVQKTVDGKEYVCIDGVCYVLSEAITGRNPSYTKPSELAMVAGGLAKFHKASAGFFPSSGTKPKYHLGLWVEDYIKQLEDIRVYYENDLAKKEPDPITALIIREFPHFYERAEKAIEGLRGKEYTDWVYDVKEKGSLCHQDFAAGNLLITPSEDLYVLDTDSLTVDIAARDIRKILNKVMKKSGKWQPELAKEIIRHYQKYNPLTPSQWEVVRLDLLFPHLFIGAVNKFYRRRDKEWSDEKYMQRISEMSAFEKTGQPILDNFKSLLPS
jgi:spore coat-associated protein S